MKIFLTIVLAIFASIISAEENALERALYDQWDYCWGALAGEYKLKGENITKDDSILELSEERLRAKFFQVPDDAVETFVIGKDGQVGHLVYREELLCDGKAMSDGCGSSGCTRDFAINDKIYALHGGEPILVNANGKPVLLLGKSGTNCNTGPNAADCFQAYVWDEHFKQFNAFGGHKRPIR
jgi:hypothetical protein